MEVVDLEVNPIFQPIYPGIGGTLGDTLPQVFLRTSAPDMALRPKYTKAQLIEKGSNLSRGSVPTKFSKGYAGVVIEDGPYSSEIKPRIKSYVMSGRSPLYMAANILPRKQDSWKSKVLNIEHRNRKNPGFYPLPGGYPRSGISRGPEPRRTVLFDPTDSTRNSPYGNNLNGGSMQPSGGPIVQPPPGTTNPITGNPTSGDPPKCVL